MKDFLTFDRTKLVFIKENIAKRLIIQVFIAPLSTSESIWY